MEKSLISILCEYYIHKHKATCKKNGHAGNNKDCCMSYPQPIFDDIALYLDEHMDTEAKQVIINCMNIIFP